MWNDFKAFVMRGNVMDLAVGVIVGAAFGSVVTALVEDVIMPPIGLLTGGIDFTNQFVVLKNGAKAAAPYASLAAAKDAGATTLAYGHFLNTVVTFLVIALAVFMLVRLVNKLYHQPAPPTPDSKPCPYCTLTVSISALRCPHCTSELTTAIGGARPTTV